MARPKRTRFFRAFIRSEQASGVLLIISTIISLIIANSAYGTGYLAFWEQPVQLGFGDHALTEPVSGWINDGLMAIFFLLVGCEIKREFKLGELSDPKSAALPAMAAIGGMVLPAGLYLLVNAGLPTAPGAGIPMATDIAFVLGTLSLVGGRAPFGLKVFLTALAVIDDLGAISVIAIFYSKSFSLPFFLGAMAVLAVLVLLNRMRVWRLWPYLTLGLVLWFCVLESGIHATVAGVLLALTIPLGKGAEHSPLLRLEHALHRPVNLGIMPIFALANTGIIVESNFLSSLTTPDSIGILLGLLIGKPVGIVFMAWLAVRLGIAQLPDHVGWKQIVGAGFLGGIGFTMSIFVAVLAFDNPVFVNSSKITVLVASLLAGLAGYFILRYATLRPTEQTLSRQKTVSS